MAKNERGEGHEKTLEQENAELRETAAYERGRREALEEMLARGVGGAGGAPPDTHATRAAKTDEQIRELNGYNRMLPPVRRQRRRSSETEATFVALVVPNTYHPEGRVERLDEYTYPEGCDRHEGEGGRVPDGMDIKHPNTGQLQPAYKQWCYETFLLTDLRRFVKDDKTPNGKGVKNLERYSELVEDLGGEPERMPEFRRGPND